MTEKEFIEHFDRTHPNLKETMGESNYNFVKNWLHGAYSMGYTEKANEAHNVINEEIEQTKKFIVDEGNLPIDVKDYCECLNRLNEFI